MTAIIVSYNTRELTLKCLDRLMPQLVTINGDVILVDNASTDGSVDAVRRSFPVVNVIANRENVGFGPANNQAIAVARGAALLLINSDAFLYENALSLLHDSLEASPQVGIVGPKLLNADGSLQPSAWPFPTPMRSWVEALWLSRLFRRNWHLRDWRRWSYDVAASVPWLIGACLLVRREVFEAVGGFDETFFLYGEETEWQRRVRDAGWDVRFLPTAMVTHVGGASGLAAKERTRLLFCDGLDRYVRKHHGLMGVISSRVAMATGSALRLPLFALLWLARPRDPKASKRVAKVAWLLRRHLCDWRCLRGEWTR